MAFRRQPFLTGSGTGRSIRSARLPAQTPEPGSAPGADPLAGPGSVAGCRAHAGICWSTARFPNDGALGRQLVQPAGERTSHWGQVSQESGVPAAERIAQGETEARFRETRSAGTPDAPQIRMVTELAETPASILCGHSGRLCPGPLSGTPGRYDGGFELYP